MALKAARHGNGSMAIGICLDHSHQGAAPGERVLEKSGIVDQRVQVNFPPGPVAEMAGFGRQLLQNESGGKGGQQDSAEMTQAVVQKNDFQMEKLRSATNQNDQPGMEQIDQHGQRAQGL